MNRWMNGLASLVAGAATVSMTACGSSNASHNANASVGTTVAASSNDGSGDDTNSSPATPDYSKLTRQNLLNAIQCPSVRNITLPGAAGVNLTEGFECHFDQGNDMDFYHFNTPDQANAAVSSVSIEGQPADSAHNVFGGWVIASSGSDENFLAGYAAQAIGYDPDPSEYKQLTLDQIWSALHCSGTPKIKSYEMGDEIDNCTINGDNGPLIAHDKNTTFAQEDYSNRNDNTPNSAGVYGHFVVATEVASDFPAVDQIMQQLKDKN